MDVQDISDEREKELRYSKICGDFLYWLSVSQFLNKDITPLRCLFIK
jgi:hypothetical protein